MVCMSLSCAVLNLSAVAPGLSVCGLYPDSIAYGRSSLVELVICNSLTASDLCADIPYLAGERVQPGRFRHDRLWAAVVKESALTIGMDISTSTSDS